MKYAQILIVFFFTFQQSWSQECKVMIPALEGKYEGDCKNGKADGAGKASGIDIYSGHFKNGYPDGQGMYIWQNQNFYSGNFKEGRMDGKGEMHYKHSISDSVVFGFWKKDKYTGQFEKPFIVQATTSNVNRVSCRNTRKAGNIISLRLHQLTGATNNIAQVVNPPTIVSISVLSGTFNSKTDQNLGNSTVTMLQQVEYPFRAIFYFSNNENAEIILNEKGDWDINIDMM